MKNIWEEADFRGENEEFYFVAYRFKNAASRKTSSDNGRAHFEIYTNKNKKILATK